jgi:hypothetical protein
MGNLGPVDLADAAEKLMNQVVQTVHTYQTTAGPALEAHISDPNLGDVRMVVTGRAGEILQAQLVVRDRIAADAITAAAARMHAAGDALAGVSVSVRSEGGGSAGGSRSGGAFDGTGWAAADGYGTGSGQGGNAGHRGGLDNQNAAAADNGAGGGAESGRGDGSRGTPRPALVALPEQAGAVRPMPRTPLPGGPSLDVRA